MSESSLYREVIVGTDGSATATRAVRAAIELARQLGVPLTLVTAWYREVSDGPPPSEEATYPGGSAASMEAHHANVVTSDAAGLARSRGIEDVHQLTPVGNPAEELIELGESRPGSLIVVGTRGLDSAAERIVGNVPHQLTHHSDRDLLLIRSVDRDEEGTGRPQWRRVALATDGSPTAALACEHGYVLAVSLGATPVLLTVAKDQDEGETTLQRAAGQFADGADLERRVAVGARPAQTLTEVGADFDLVVIGNKGMSGPSRLLGSVSNRVTHHAPTDLLLVNTTR